MFLFPLCARLLVCCVCEAETARGRGVSSAAPREQAVPSIGRGPDLQADSGGAARVGGASIEDLKADSHFFFPNGRIAAGAWAA